MADQFEYDVFLSHASEDREWCEQLAERLRNDGVRVWFDEWQLKPGDHLLKRLNDGLKKSRKMVVVWSTSYFRDDKVWTLAEGYSQQHPDVLAQERSLIPLLIETCDILPTFKNLIYIDFRNKDDFDLRLRQLIEALDLPCKEFAKEEVEAEFREHELDRAKLGKLAREKGKRFEDEVAKLYELLGFEVEKDLRICGFQIDLLIEQKIGGLHSKVIVKCKDKFLTSSDRDQILAMQNVIQKEHPAMRWITVSSKGFSKDTREALNRAGFGYITYDELLRELVPLDQYVEKFIQEYELWIFEKWRGEDWFIRPDILTDITYEKQSALSYIAKWLGNDRANQLTLLGDLGTGKSTLARFLAYNLARSFKDDALRHPAPVLIPLREVRKEVSLEGMIISHFSKQEIQGINYPRFEHLVKMGKVILLFDAFDEMADRVRWEVTKNNFDELNRAAMLNGKVMPTCRTHYFKDRNEQVKLIGEGPSLSEIETDLYRALRQKSWAEVVYLQEFSDEQIQAYLTKARPDTASEDWEKIQDIYNLKDLAHRPLLLDMIVKSLPKLETGQEINAASLYNVYTNIWIEREESKGRILDKTIKGALMQELAWRMWDEEKSDVYYKDLAPFIEKLAAAKVVEFGDEETEDIAREMQVAKFLKRDDKGNFSFVHRSFMEYFLAQKIYQSLKEEKDKTEKFDYLNTRRFDRKIIYFLHLIDDKEDNRHKLQRILTTAYQKNISENSLQILYWCGRYRMGMEDKIDDSVKLTRELTSWLPKEMKLQEANLQEIVLEAAPLHHVLLNNAELTKANLNSSLIHKTNFLNASLNGSRLEKATIQYSDFKQSNLDDAVFYEAHLKACDFTDASFENTKFSLVIAENCKNWIVEPRIRKADLIPVVHRFHASGVSAVAFHPSEDLAASGSGDGTIILFRPSDGKAVRVLEGHKDWVNSVHFAGDGKLLASGSSDQTVRLWQVATGKCVAVLAGHLDPVQAVQFAPNGKYLVAAGFAGRLQFWDIQTGETFLYRYHFGPGAWLDLLQDGRFNASPEGMRYLCYTEQGTFNSFTAEELVKEFYDPEGVKKIIENYM